MQSFYQRYQDGEYEQVWTDLVALGPAVRQEPVYTDALAVAQTMMHRARQNVALLVERLRTLNYRFAHPRNIWIPPTAHFLKQLHYFDHHYGPLPIVLRTWFEVLGEIDLTGAHPTLSYYAGLSPRSSSAPSSDPLSIGSTASYLLKFIESPGGNEMEGPPYEFVLAPDSCHKANTSGGGITSILVPNPGFDACLTEEWDGIYFIPYLRECFRWGGFPGFADDPYAAEDAQTELAILTKELLPL